MRARVATSIAAISLLGLGLAGCNFVTPQATTKHYDASDGISATIGKVKVVNVLAITDEEGENINLVLTAVNRTGEIVTLSAQYDAGGSATDETVKLQTGVNDIGHGEDGQFLLEGADAPAGSLLSVYLQYGDQPGKQLLVPVLDGTWADYADLVPTPKPTPTEDAPEPGSSESPTPDPSETATAP